MSAEIQANHLILARIERLERQNSRLKRGALAFLVFVPSLFMASLGLTGQVQRKSPAPRAGKPAPAATPPPAPALPQNIEAQSFTLKDANGRARAKLSMGGEGPSFKLLDESGAAVVTLSLLDASPGGPLLLLSDPQHVSSLSMSVVAGQGPQLSLIGARADIQAHIGVAPDGSTFELSDKDGFTASIGNGVQPTKGGQVKKTSAASIALFNKDRKLLWSAP
jgi:hypothetical protein